LQKGFCMGHEYDVIVVGAGHAGSEAAASAANLGVRVLLITMDMTKIAQMSCNPAMGGVAKGQIIREIDAMGGYSGIVTDKSMIQFRMLNRSKGPAMWSPRAQCDRLLFTKVWRETLESISNIDFWQDSVVELILSKDSVKGVVTRMGVKFYSKSVILTSGTFQNGLMHIGSVKIAGGRASDAFSYGISEQLSKFGFDVGRMKTGTPARIDGRSVDFSKLTEQKGDYENRKFSYINIPVDYSSHRSCYITHTNKEVHDLLREGFDKSPLFDGTIQSIGPRYCPSIEDKIRTFADKESHQLFLEPEGLNTVEYYINGFSSSLPLNVQFNALSKVPGLENVKIFRPGYAIEYDYYPPVQLKKTLETRLVQNLYFAGQINGTTGYEEAAAQGLMAGINAALKIKGEGEVILGRDEAYIGVLIDDLITKGVDEPYRMFTSRAEYRLLLRQDDADERLTEKSYKIGLADFNRMNLLRMKVHLKSAVLKFLNETSADPEKVNSFLTANGTSRLTQKIKAIELLKRPQVSIHNILNLFPDINGYFIDDMERKDEILESVEIKVKYEGYIERERILAEKIQRLEKIKIHGDILYESLNSISTEARMKLRKHQPATIGEAMRISGVSPSDINVLLMYMGR
jgi:tRNA uridine 5-carboxymethylaminomethyl modification enzyme